MAASSDEWQLATIFFSDNETLIIASRGPETDDGHGRPAVYIDDTLDVDAFFDYPRENKPLCEYGKTSKRWLPADMGDKRGLWRRLIAATEYRERECELLKTRPAIVADVVDNGDET